MMTRQIAEQFVQQYWRHAVPYGTDQIHATPGVLAQNLGTQAAVLTAIEEFRSTLSSTTLQKARGEVGYGPCCRKVAAVVSAQPLTYLQNFGGMTDPFLYERRSRHRGPQAVSRTACAGFIPWSSNWPAITGSSTSRPIVGIRAFWATQGIWRISSLVPLGSHSASSVLACGSWMVRGASTAGKGCRRLMLITSFRSLCIRATSHTTLCWRTSSAIGASPTLWQAKVICSDGWSG